MSNREPIHLELDDTNSIKCWCQGCGQEFRIHPLFPRVHSDLSDHDCPHTIPTPTFQIEVIEVKPYDMPITSLLFMKDYEIPELPELLLPPKTRIE